MDIASVMAVVDGSVRSRAAMRAALDLGRVFDAHTHLLQVSPLPMIVVPRLQSPASRTVDDMMHNLRDHTEHRRLQFETFFDEDVLAGGLPVCITDGCSPKRRTGFEVCKEVVTGHESREIARRGKLFDLIVIVAPTEEEGGVDSAVLEATLFDTGRPALLIPGSYDRSVGEHVLIAWDGSTEAAKSIHNAMPLIRRAKQVEVIHVRDGRRQDIDPVDVAKYLALHGVEATTRTIDCADGLTADCLAEAARANGCALIVMGAYGDNPMRNGGYGNITRALVGNADVPILIAH